MPIERQRLIELIFLEAADLAPRERIAFLAARCGDDTDLRREVDSLLGAHEGETGLLDAPQPMTMGLMQQLSGLLKADDAAMPASGKIGAYRVIRVLGSGGMGVVYLAEQERPKRTVALKVIRRGLATASLLRRFEHEAEILGRLHHPGIAQIFEAGVADDGSGPQPYIAMEYIDGRPLTEHASINKLGLREKLLLMTRICDAVQHAHQRAVIHRDLKPGNILVQHAHTADHSQGDSTAPGASNVNIAAVGQPKILDFGVARIAEDPAGDGRHTLTTMGTNVGQLIGTLAYMSPEQLDGEAGGRDVDTRSDVYALGVVFYQLLTGKLPYDVTRLPLPEAVRKIKEDPPTRLSTIERDYKGDLETIVGKAIEKDPARRYQSAADLGADIQRFLLNEPIAAKRDSAVYVLRKQMLRYKSAVGAGAIGVIALVAFTVYAAMSAERFKAMALSERLASQAAQMEKDRADAAARKLQQELFVSNVERGRLEGVSGKVVVAEEFLWSEYFRDPDSPHAHWALWELYERSPCRWTVQGPRKARCAAPSGNGAFFVVGDETNRVTIMDTSDGSVVDTFGPLPAAPMSVALDHPGKQVLIGLANGRVCAATVGAGEPPRYLLDAAAVHDGAIRATAWSPDGKLLATGGNDLRIRLWNADTLAPLADWKAHTQPVSCLAFDNASTRLASGSYESGESARVRIWSVPTGAPAGEINPRESVILALAFTPDGAKVASAGFERFVMLHDLAADSTTVFPGKFSGPTTSIAFSTDGAFILASGGGECRTWLVEDRQPLLTLGQHRGNILAAAWTAPGRAASFSYDGAMKSWDARRAMAMRGVGRFNSWCFGTAYSPDGRLMAIASGDGTIVIADADTRKRLHVVRISDQHLRTRPVRFLPDNQTLLAGCADGMVRVIDAATGAVTRQFGSRGAEIFAIALHPRTRQIATGHRDLAVRIWDLSTGTLLHELKDPGIIDRVEGVDISPDGKLLACSGLERGILLWDTETWRPVATLPGASQAWPVAFSPDGKSVLAGTWGDAVDVWEVSTRLHVGALTGHRGLISSIAFSPDGNYVASGGDDATVKLWHLKSRRCVLTLDTYHGEATGLSFHPSGERLTTGAQDHAAPTWDLTTFNPHIAGNREYQRARFKAAPITAK